MWNFVSCTVWVQNSSWFYLSLFTLPDLHSFYQQLRHSHIFSSVWCLVFYIEYCCYTVYRTFCFCLCGSFVRSLMLKIAYLVQDVLFKWNITHPKHAEMVVLQSGIYLHGVVMFVCMRCQLVKRVVSHHSHRIALMITSSPHTVCTQIQDKNCFLIIIWRMDCCLIVAL